MNGAAIDMVPLLYWFYYYIDIISFGSYSKLLDIIDVVGGLQGIDFKGLVLVKLRSILSLIFFFWETFTLFFILTVLIYTPTGSV